jgi:hypothetical protein
MDLAHPVPRGMNRKRCPLRTLAKSHRRPPDRAGPP